MSYHKLRSISIKSVGSDQIPYNGQNYQFLVDGDSAVSGNLVVGTTNVGNKFSALDASMNTFITKCQNISYDASLNDTNFTGDINTDGSFTMTNTTKTCTLQKATLNGATTIIGAITQSGTGTNSLKGTDFTGGITQSNGTNTLKATEFTGGITQSNGTNTLKQTTFTGDVSVSTGKTLQGLPNTIYTYLNSITSNVQTQINNITTTSQNMTYDASLNITNFTGDVNVAGNLQGLSSTVYGYLNSISSNVQTQINSANTNITTLQTKTTAQTYNSGTTTTSYTGNVSVAGNIQGLSSTIYGYLNSISSNVQTQINSANTNITALQTKTTSQTYTSGTTTTSYTGNVNVAGNLQGLSSTVYGYLNSISSNVQTQINSANTNITTLQTQINNISDFDVSEITTNLNTVINKLTYFDKTSLNINQWSTRSFFNEPTFWGDQRACFMYNINPSSHSPTIYNEVINDTNPILVASVIIPAYNYCSVSFTQSMAFVKSVNGIGFLGGAPYAFKNTLGSITYTIYKNGSLIDTIVKTINYEFVWYIGTVTAGNSYEAIQYVYSLAPFLIDEDCLLSSTTYEIYASLTQSAFNPTFGTSINGGASGNGSYSTFLFNSSTTPSTFSFSYGASRGTTCHDGALHVSEIRVNEIYNSQIDTNTINTASITVSNNITCDNMSISSPISFTGSTGMMTRANTSGLNYNTSNGGSLKQFVFGNGYYLVHLDDGNRSNASYQVWFYLMVVDSVNATKTNIDIPANHSITMVSKGFNISCAIGSGSTGFFCYYLRYI